MWIYSAHMIEFKIKSIEINSIKIDLSENNIIMKYRILMILNTELINQNV